MRIRTMAVVASGVVLALSATACGGSGAGGSTNAQTTSKIAGSGSGVGKTLTVWYMQDDLSDATQKAINDKFTELTGAQVKVEF